MFFDAIEALFDMLFGLLDAILTWGLEIVVEWWRWIQDGVGGLVAELWGYAYGKLPASWAEQINNAFFLFSEYRGTLDDISWILPVWPVMSIVGVTIGIQAVLRLIRWVLAFIPTIGG